MYQIEFYENRNGKSELWEFLEELRIKSASNKSCRIEYNQITLYLELLSKNGMNLSKNIAKPIIQNIWELRPGNNRIFYFYYENGTFVLLHQFRKKTQKTPKREIDRALAERNDYITRSKEAKPL